LSAYLNSETEKAYSVAEIAQVCQELVVVGSDKVGPQESRIIRFWALRDQVVSPNSSGLASFTGVVAEHTAASAQDH
jgi:hypothetical protein